jgi:Domain of unknown function (DUF4349)
MTGFQKIIAATGFGLLFLGCNQFKAEKAAGQTNEEAIVADTISLPATVVNGTETGRKFIRTADLRFEVSNVISATDSIEGIVLAQRGFVVFTHLASKISGVSQIALSTDSVLKTTTYFTTNIITCRVPDAALNATLKAFSKNIVFLDHRVINANDVSIQLKANQLLQKRTAIAEQRLIHAIDKTGKKLTETTAAEELLQNKLEANDAAGLSDLTFNDQINFSTIQLLLYQPESTRNERIASENERAPYEPGFSQKMRASLLRGWHGMAAFLVFITQFWVLVLCLFAVGYTYFMHYPKFLQKRSKTLPQLSDRR